MVQPERPQNQWIQPRRPGWIRVCFLVPLSLVSKTRHVEFGRDWCCFLADTILYISAHNIPWDFNRSHIMFNEIQRCITLVRNRFNLHGQKLGFMVGMDLNIQLNRGMCRDSICMHTYGCISTHARVTSEAS